MKRFGKVSAGTALLALVPGLPGAFLPGLPGLHLKPKTPPNAAAGPGTWPQFSCLSSAHSSHRDGPPSR